MIFFFSWFWVKVQSVLLKKKKKKNSKFISSIKTKVAITFLKNLIYLFIYFLFFIFYLFFLLLFFFWGGGGENQLDAERVNFVHENKKLIFYQNLQFSNIV